MDGIKKTIVIPKTTHERHNRKGHEENPQDRNEKVFQCKKACVSFALFADLLRVLRGYVLFFSKVFLLATRLAVQPTTKVTQVPTMTHHVHGTLVSNQR